MVKSSTKPDAWTLSPQMTAAPELWRGRDKVCVPMWTISQSDANQNEVDPATGKFNTLEFNSSNYAPTVTPSGPGVESGLNDLRTDFVLLPNIIGGKSEFTFLAIVTPTTTNADQTVVGRWTDEATIILHFDDNNKVRFIVSAGGTIGDWTADTYSINTEYLMAARLTKQGEMAVWLNGSKNVIRTGSGLIVDNVAASLGYMNDGVNSGTNDIFYGTSSFLYGTDVALSEGSILAWTRDPFAMLRPAGF